MASQAKDVIIIRVKPAIKWAARRAAKAQKQNLTEYISELIVSDNIGRDTNGRRMPEGQ
jgi:uncharacterized protein (DUF1778 family)